MSNNSNTDYITIEKCDEMIAKAIDNHNKTATLISASLGSILLFFYAHGVMCLVDRLT